MLSLRQLSILYPFSLDMSRHLPPTHNSHRLVQGYFPRLRCRLKQCDVHFCSPFSLSRLKQSLAPTQSASQISRNNALGLDAHSGDPSGETLPDVPPLMTDPLLNSPSAAPQSRPQSWKQGCHSANIGQPQRIRQSHTARVHLSARCTAGRYRFSLVDLTAATTVLSAPHWLAPPLRPRTRLNMHLPARLAICAAEHRGQDGRRPRGVAHLQLALLLREARLGSAI